MLIHMDLKRRATYPGPSAAQRQHGDVLRESMTRAAQHKIVPEPQTPVWTSVWVTGAGQELWEVPWQPSWSLWQPPTPKDSYWLAVTVPNATGAGLRCQVFITHPSGRERRCQRYIFLLLLYFFITVQLYPQLYPIQSFFSLSFSVFTHTETVVAGPSLFLPVGKAGVFRDLFSTSS